MKEEDNEDFKFVSTENCFYPVELFHIKTYTIIQQLKIKRE